MSFQNYENFPNQQGQQDAGGAGPGLPQQQDTPMGGQMPDNPAGQFQAGNGGDLGAAGVQQQGGDAKTTLWYDFLILLYSCIDNKNGLCKTIVLAKEYIVLVSRTVHVLTIIQDGRA